MSRILKFYNQSTVIVPIIVSLLTTAIVPFYQYVTRKPSYSFVLNNPVGWTKDDDIFSIYNYGSDDMKDTTVYIRSYMILSSNSHSDYFDDYISTHSLSIPMEGLDMRFQLTGKSKGKIGHINFNTDKNPFSNYFSNNNVEFGPNLNIDISNRINENNLQINTNDIDSGYDKMNLVIFTIFINNTSKTQNNLSNIQVYATDYSSDYDTGKSRTKLIPTNIYFEQFEDKYEYDYAKYYNREDYDRFWNDKDIINTYYSKFIDQIINDYKKRK